LRQLILRNSGKPELRCHPRLSRKEIRRGCPAAQTSLRSLRKLDCVPGMTDREIARIERSEIRATIL
jgi:hypothetical protein